MDLAYLSATDALALFRARGLSPVELMRAVIDRAEKTEARYLGKGWAYTAAHRPVLA